VSGDRRVDLKKASSALGARNVSTVPFGKAESISGYPPGGTPTLGHKTPMRTVLDKSLVTFKTVFCGGGSRSLLLELRMKDILEISQAIVADISEG
jgi:Cys-tRNA(Pro)/Cys-tRNA(Cys) deacylase